MLLKKNFIAKQFKKLLSLIDEQDSPKNVANMSGKINCFLAGFKTNSWIIDIGASNHMVSSKMCYSYLCSDITCYQYLNLPKTYNVLHLSILIFFLFEDLYTGKVKGTGKVRDGLYILSTKSLLFLLTVHKLHCCFSTQTKNSVWHQRLGHAPVSILSQIHTMKHTLNTS